MKKLIIALLMGAVLAFTACKGKLNHKKKDSIAKSQSNEPSSQDTMGMSRMEAQQDSAAGIDNSTRN